tara:strand:- start:533 stop:781 length:249 start_codon:yes stop_codon:yes gene_type:complete
MSMTRKHFIKIANVVNNNAFGFNNEHTINKKNVVNELIEFFKKDNKNFKPKFFYYESMRNEINNNDQIAIEGYEKLKESEDK